MTNHERDAAWSQALRLPRTMTPEEAKKWLEKEAERIRQEIVDATRYKGTPKWY